MLIATFGPTTAWNGKTITLVNEQFVLEGHGVVSADALVQYDRQGHLVWPYDGMRDWVYQRAGAPLGAAAQAARPQTYATPTQAQGQAGSPQGSAPEPAQPQQARPEVCPVCSGRLAPAFSFCPYCGTRINT
jgi:hypothetical protein